MRATSTGLTRSQAQRQATSMKETMRSRDAPFRQVRGQDHALARSAPTSSQSGNVTTFSVALWSWTSGYSGLVCVKSGQDFLLFALGHMEVVERAGKLSSDFIEHCGCDV